MKKGGRTTVQVAFPLPLDDAYTYEVPDGWEEIPEGCRVAAPLRNKVQVGFVVESGGESGSGRVRLKQLHARVDAEPPFSDNLLRLLKWMSEYYLCPLGLVMKSALPSGMSVKKKRIVRLANPDAIEWNRLSEQMEVIAKRLTDRGHYSMTHLRRIVGKVGFGAALEALLKSGAIEVDTEYSGYAGASAGNVGGRPEAGVQLEEVLLTPAQAEVFTPIRRSVTEESNKVFLLHGVTGSGKTEIYMRASKEALEAGGTALILVPEIALTPQISERFSRYFGGLVAVQHSGMTPADRRKAWERAKSGDAKVVVGARSALYAPLGNLKLIVVDEEQEPSYKQDEPDPRYNARDMAVVRAGLEGATVILGSATPSFESFHNATDGKYEYMKLGERFDTAGSPVIELVDLKVEFSSGGYRTVIISERLKSAIHKCLGAGEQVVLLQNRRGFAPFIRCRECGYTENCPDCDVTLTYHKPNSTLRCHYCGHRRAIPLKCPSCGSRGLLFHGVGTQRVEDELERLFPKARVCRMDVDTTSTRGAHWRLLKKFEAGKFEILLGTQMIAKGLDFENVTLVGIISADTGLYLPDFRAGERTFHLISQVAGRAGRRKKKGEVIVQTSVPESFSLQCAKDNDQKLFYETGMKERSDLGYPPYGRLVLLETSSPDRRTAMKGAAKVYEDLSRIFEEGELLGPAPSPIERLRGRYRWRVMVRIGKNGGKSIKTVKSSISTALKVIRKNLPRDARLAVDVDPLSMM